MELNIEGSKNKPKNNLYPIGVIFDLKAFTSKDLLPNNKPTAKNEVKRLALVTNICKPHPPKIAKKGNAGKRYQANISPSPPVNITTPTQ